LKLHKTLSKKPLELPLGGEKKRKKVKKVGKKQLQSFMEKKK